MRKHDRSEEHTTFQEASPYFPETDSRADVAIVYGLNPTFEERVARWREAGYRIHVMTGVAWGSYQDYVRGEWDGKQHYDDAQAAAGGFKLEHGLSQGHDCFYMMPSKTYARYLSEGLHRVVDAGALAIHLEEPEFWVRGGYGEGFQREWAEFYGEPWQDPASSPDAQYRASKLKQYLYTRTLDFLFHDLKTYAAEKGVADFKCYVPTHSLVNYAHWRIVSPESQLLTIPDCDGMIAQVWTGTSRTPTVYGGVPRQRTFEAGYCEYAACAAIVRGTDKRVWMLADPIEDNPTYCWEDYRVNWECTVTGSLLVAGSVDFEIMPWPRRVFMGSYPTHNLMADPLLPMMDDYLTRLKAAAEAEKQGVDDSQQSEESQMRRRYRWMGRDPEEVCADTQRAFDLFLSFYAVKGQESRRETLGFANLATESAELRFGDIRATANGLYRELATWEDQADAQRIRDALARFMHRPTDDLATIPESYSTELQVVFNALRDMDWPGEVTYLHGMAGIGLGIADSLMFQRGDPEPSDPDMSSLYGLAMPLVKHGVALDMVQLERAGDPGYLDNVRVLLLTYEGQKPLSSAVHDALAAWVHKGNVLMLYGTGDAYNTVREWWNQDGATYERPQDHLTELLGVGRDPAAGSYTVGAGTLMVIPASPAALAHDVAGPAQVLERVEDACKTVGLPWATGNHLVLRRGPYVVAAGMDESTSDDTLALTGSYVNLYDPALPVVVDPLIVPDTRWLLYDLARCPGQAQQTWAWVIAAAGRVEDEVAGATALTFTVEGMAKTMCAVRVRVPLAPVSVQVGGVEIPVIWDGASRTALLRFPNDPAGVKVQVSWGV